MPLSRAKISALFPLVVIFSCSPDKKSPTADSIAVVQPPPPATAPVAVNTGWDETEAGPLMLVASADNPGVASVVIPSFTDSALAGTSGLSIDSLAGMSFDLLDRIGVKSSGRLARKAQTVQPDCLAWPSMTLELDSQRAWQVGFRRGMVTALPLDSIESFSASDSSFVTTELARLASAVPGLNDSAFQGLPFAVKKAYRSSSSRPTMIIGEIVRTINEEANPREEHLLLIAERSADDPAHYRTVFQSRAAGSEDLVRTSNVMAAVRFVNGGRTAVVIAFEYENGNRMVLIERLAPYQWKETWRSAYAGC